MGLNSNQSAFEQTAAAGIATAIAADLHGTPVVSGTTARFQFQIPQAGYNTDTNGDTSQTLYFAQDGTPTGVESDTALGKTPPARYRATVTFQVEDTLGANPSGVTAPTPRNRLFRVWILITWPALADPTPTAFPANFAGSYETVTALDCN
jgi:hypothetical protein